MKKSIILIVLALLCLNFYGKAQEKTIAKQGLKIGEKVPEEFWQIQHVVYKNGKVTKQNFEVYRGKLIILDFMGFHCAPCIEALPKMLKIQTDLQKQLQFLVVTSENKENVSKFMARPNIAEKRVSELTFLLEGQQLNKYFPHFLVPHYAWIGANGTVKAITSEAEINEKNIRSVIENEEVNYAQKKDVNVDHPLFLEEEYPKNLEHYSISFKGAIGGTGSSKRFRKTDRTTGIVFANAPLINMIDICAKKLIAGYDPKMRVLEGVPSSELFAPIEKTARKKWFEDNDYTLDFNIPLRDSAKLYQSLLEEICRFSPYTVDIEKRKQKYYTIEEIKGSTGFISKGGAFKALTDSVKGIQITNARVLHLIDALSDLKSLPYPLFSHIKYTGNIDINVPPGKQDYRSLKELLKGYGLNLKEKTGEIDMMVIRRKSAAKTDSR
jgi:thiol-disulfide isomerase/thioredoxin